MAEAVPPSRESLHVTMDVAVEAEALNLLGILNAPPDTIVETQKTHDLDGVVEMDEIIDWEEYYHSIYEEKELSIKTSRESALATIAMERKRVGSKAHLCHAPSPSDGDDTLRSLPEILYVLDWKSAKKVDGKYPALGNFYALAPFQNLLNVQASNIHETAYPATTKQPEPNLRHGRNDQVDTWEQLSKPVFEITTEIYGDRAENALGFQDNTDINSGSNYKSTAKSSSAPQQQKFRGLKGIEFDRKGASRMTIYSECLLDMLKSIVSYFPSQSLTGLVTIREPYIFLLLHIKDIRARLASANGQITATATQLEEINSGSGINSKSSMHTQILLDYLRPFEQQHLQPLHERVGRKVPVVLYRELLLLMMPGIDVYFEWEGKVVSGVIYSATYDGLAEQELPTEKTLTFGVTVWSLQYDADGISKMKDSKIRINNFDGERAITSLPIYPSSIWDAEDGGARRRHFQKRGESLLNLSRYGPKQVFYNGKLYGSKSKRAYRGLVVATLDADDEENDEDPDATDVSFVEHSDKGHEGSGSVNRFLDYENLEYKNAPILSDHIYFLSMPFIPGFCIKEKMWRLFDVDCIEEYPPRNNSLNYLVIEDGNKKVVQAISDPQSKTWRLDFIQGKGEGQIILLHGPPGVGKTYTVECVAESTGRPLIALTIADIGLSESKVERQLTKWFSLAEAWNGILLIDEADIFLERRKGADIARNGLVSAFLRKMEYFSGLLFLTTNRIGQIDDAFLSRVHVVIGYGRFTDDKRKEIWKGFFKKLALDMKEPATDPLKPKLHIRVNEYAKEYVLEDPVVLALQWNGREIRNAFQTAITLAGYEAMRDENWMDEKTVTIKKEHFQDVVRMSGEFHKYMNSIDNRNEADRARARYERNDE